ncbi:MAG TPA: hypothetical protein VIH56_00755 [Candidatus Acidoferrales bacterium]
MLTAESERSRIYRNVIDQSRQRKHIGTRRVGLFSKGRGTTESQASQECRRRDQFNQAGKIMVEQASWISTKGRGAAKSHVLRTL